MPRKDIFGTEIEVGDIVFSAPNSSSYSTTDVGIVHSVSDKGDRWTPSRVMIRVPSWQPIYAYEIPGAPLVPGEKWGYLKDAEGNDIWEEDRWGGKRKKFGAFPAMVRNTDKVGEGWRWRIIQGAWYNLIVLRKGQVEGEVKTLEELFNLTELSSRLTMDYTKHVPDLPSPEGK